VEELLKRGRLRVEVGTRLDGLGEGERVRDVSEKVGEG